MSFRLSLDLFVQKVLTPHVCEILIVNFGSHFHFYIGTWILVDPNSSLLFVICGSIQMVIQLAKESNPVWLGSKHQFCIKSCMDVLGESLLSLWENTRSTRNAKLKVIYPRTKLKHWGFG